MKLKGRILIVDDEPINLEFFDVMLTNLGFEIVKASDGVQALEMVEQTNPDLILLDNVMPRLTGWEVAKRLKQDKQYQPYSQTPIIMFSAMDEVQDKIEGLELGVDDYITKPFNFSEVLARIRAVLRNRELARQVARREQRLAVVESLNRSLLFFTQHIRKPISELMAAAKKVDSSGSSVAGRLAAAVKSQGAEILATLEGLEEEIGELQAKGDRLKSEDLNLEDLERKLKKHLRDWNKQPPKGREAGA